MKIVETTRMYAVFFILAGLYLFILGNVYILQIKRHPYFIELAKQQYSTTITIHPERALIYDRHGKPLVLNEPRWSAFIIPKLIKDKSPIKSFLAQHFPDAYKRLLEHPYAHFMFVKRQLPLIEKKRLEEYNFADLHVLKEPYRYYPIACASHIAGITDIDNNGLAGIELIYDQTLKGEPGIMQLERDARSGNYYFDKLSATGGKKGSAIHTTIDSSLQFIVHDCLQKTIKQFNAQEGMALVMEPKTGNILASAQYPLYDPNNRSEIAIAHTKNKMATESYELGSVMKVFAAMAALEEQVVTPEELVDCENTKSTFINGIKVNTWKAHGEIPFSQVIQVSNNIGIAKVAQRLGTKLYDHYKKLGFTQKTGLNWSGEQKGYITPPKEWSKQSLISLSFGYEIAATLIQLAQAFCLIANDGKAITPRLLKNQSITSSQQNMYSDKTIDAIKDIMEKTVTEGTAYKAALDGYRVMAKTGTANLLVNGKYSPDHNSYTVAGIIEKENYKRVIICFIKGAGKKNLYASQVAAPLFEQIAEHVLINDKIF